VQERWRRFRNRPCCPAYQHQAAATMMNPLEAIGEVLKGLLFMLISAPYMWLTGIADAVLSIPQYYTATVTETVARVEAAIVSGSDRLAAEIEANFVRVAMLSVGVLVAALLASWGGLHLNSSSLLQALVSNVGRFVVVKSLAVLVASLVAIGLWRCRHELRAGLQYIARCFVGKRKNRSRERMPGSQPVLTPERPPP